MIDAITGRPRWTHSHATDAWVEPPTFFGGKLVICAEEQYVIAREIATGHTAWTFPLSRWPSLSGELPRLRLDGGELLV